jgi:putative transposase
MSTDLNQENEIRRGRHCVSKMHCHLVFVTKYRSSVFNSEILDSMQEIFQYICDCFEAELIEFEGEENHVHLLINYPPKLTISKLVNSLKGTSSRMLRQKHPELIKHYWKGVLWSPSYFAGSCGGAPLSLIKDYIQNQNRPN